MKPSEVLTGYGDLAPVPWNNGIVFVTGKPGGKTKQGYKNLFYAHQGIISLFDEKFTSKFNDGPVSFSGDGNTICYCRNLEQGLNGNKITFGLFFSEFNGSAWSDPVPFEHNNLSYNVAHPSLSQDGNTLYFSSTMPNGYGGSDIYVSYKVDSGWTEPKNLGSKVNSSGVEVFPFIHPSGRLYFSSNAGATLGGMDIFYSEPVGDEFSFPHALPEPVNSKGDDFGVYVEADQMKGLLSSSRKKGEDRIYEFELFPQPAKNCEPVKYEPVCETFTEIGPGHKDTIDHLIYYWDFGDGKPVQGLEAKHCFNGPGTYPIKLLVKDQFLRKTEHVATFDYVVKPKDLPGIEANYQGSSKNRAVLTLIEPNLANFSSYNALWQVNEKWTCGKEVEVELSGTKAVKLVLYGKDDDDKESRRCFEVDPRDLLDAR